MLGNEWNADGVNIVQNGNSFKFNFNFFFEWELLPGLPQNIDSPDYNYNPDSPTYHIGYNTNQQNIYNTIESESSSENEESEPLATTAGLATTEQLATTKLEGPSLTTTTRTTTTTTTRTTTNITTKSTTTTTTFTTTTTTTSTITTTTTSTSTTTTTTGMNEQIFANRVLCGPELYFSGLTTKNSDLSGLWIVALNENDEMITNDGFVAYQHTTSKYYLWWMYHGNMGHWVINLTPGVHGNDRLMSSFGDFACPQLLFEWSQSVTITASEPYFDQPKSTTEAITTTEDLSTTSTTSSTTTTISSTTTMTSTTTTTSPVNTTMKPATSKRSTTTSTTTTPMPTTSSTVVFTCGKDLYFSNLAYKNSDLQGKWSIYTENGSIMTNDGFPYYKHTASSTFMWFMYHGSVGHWVVNQSPGRHGNDRFMSGFGDFSCPQAKFDWSSGVTITTTELENNVETTEEIATTTTTTRMTTTTSTEYVSTTTATTATSAWDLEPLFRLEDWTTTEEWTTREVTTTMPTTYTTTTSTTEPPTTIYTTTSTTTTTTVVDTTSTSTTLAFEAEFPTEVLCPYVVSNMAGGQYASDCKSSSRCSSKFIGPCGYALMIKLRNQLCKPHNAEMVILAIGQELAKLGREYEIETGDKCNENIKIKELVHIFIVFNPLATGSR